MKKENKPRSNQKLKQKTSKGSNKKRRQNNNEDVINNPADFLIRENLGWLKYVKWAFILATLATIPITIKGYFEYSIIGLISLCSLLSLVVLFKNKNKINNDNVIVALVTIFMLSIVCLIVAGITDGIVAIIDTFYFNTKEV